MPSKSFKISSLCFIVVPCVVNRPLSFHMVLWACITPNTYFESIHIFTRFPLLKSKALVRAINSAFCADTFDDRPHASATSDIVVSAYPDSHFPF